MKRKGAELIVLETAFREKDQVLNREKLIKEEADYLRGILGT